MSQTCKTLTSNKHKFLNVLTQTRHHKSRVATKWRKRAYHQTCKELASSVFKLHASFLGIFIGDNT